MSSSSLLPIVLASDNFPPYPFDNPTHSASGKERYIPFHITFSDFQSSLLPIGLLRPSVVDELSIYQPSPQVPTSSSSSQSPDGPSGSGVEANKAEAQQGRSPFQFYSTAEGGYDGENEEDTEMEEDVELTVECVFFADWVLEQGSEEMTRVMNDLAKYWKGQDKFCGPLEGWRNEQYQVYADPRSSFFTTTTTTTTTTSSSASHSKSSNTITGESSFSKARSNTIFTLERSACAVFGLATFGVHMTAYENDGEELRIWVPRRSKTKATFPGMLDNSVAGGIPAGMTPLESMIKECDEEASLPDVFVRKRLRCTGVITYFYITPDGYLQPELEYTYDLQLPSSSSPEYIKPKPHDDEVESFSLMSIPEVLQRMRAGEFKPNCGSVLVDFLMRHGMITPEEEPNYLQIRWSLGRKLGVAVPSSS